MHKCTPTVGLHGSLIYTRNDMMLRELDCFMADEPNRIGRNNSLTERRGVEAVRSKFADIGWYPRETTGPDHGVDLLAEVANEGVPDGRMIAIQIKSGRS